MATRDEQIVWLTDWANRNDCTLQLLGECGFGRECVGILSGEKYPDYEYDDAAAHSAPEDAYHKHDCLAVLGRGDDALAQLYGWVQAIDAAGGQVETGIRKPSDGIDALFHGFTTARLVFPDPAPVQATTPDLTEYRVTFGSQYSHAPHPTFPPAHPDGWLTVLAPTYDAARAYVVGLLGTAWSNLDAAEGFVEVSDLDGHVYYPRGELARRTLFVDDPAAALGLGKAAAETDAAVRVAGSDL